MIIDHMKKYSDSNPERFNSDFILSRDKQDMLSYIKDVFKSLEILDEIKIESIEIETDESSMGPLKDFYEPKKPTKKILESRVNKINYVIKVTPKDKPKLRPVLDLNSDVKIEETEKGESFYVKNSLYVNKLIDNCFYINDSIRYFLIYQIVDNVTYGTGKSVSLKSLLMPITVRKKEVLLQPEFNKDPIENVSSFDTLLFSKKVSPFSYFLLKESFNALVKMKVENENNIVTERQKYKVENMLDIVNDFFGVKLEMSDNLEDFVGKEDMLVFRSYEGKKLGAYIGVKKSNMENDYMTSSIVGSLLNLKEQDGKKNISFTTEEFNTPWFWIDNLSSFFFRNTDPTRKFEKTYAILNSLERIIDEATRDSLILQDEDKRDIFHILRYIMRNFEELATQDDQDLDNKKIRLFQYQYFPLQVYFSNQIYRVLNSPTRSKAVLSKMFSGLNKGYLIKQTVTSELLRYYGSPNEINLYSAFLKYTFRGPQSLNKNVLNHQRDVHPSYTGRLSLIGSSAGDPGMSGSMTPFVKIYDGYFKNHKASQE